MSRRSRVAKTSHNFLLCLSMHWPSQEDYRLFDVLFNNFCKVLASVGLGSFMFPRKEWVRVSARRNVGILTEYAPEKTDGWPHSQKNRWRNIDCGWWRSICSVNLINDEVVPLHSPKYSFAWEKNHSFCRKVEETRQEGSFSGTEGQPS